MLKRFSGGAGTFSALALFAFSTSAYAAHFKTGLWNVSETLINTGGPSSPSFAPVQVCMPDDILESYVNAMLAHRDQDLKSRFKECKDADEKISQTARESSFLRRPK